MTIVKPLAKLWPKPRSLFLSVKTVFDRLLQSRLWRKTTRALLAFDAFIDSSLYASGERAKDRYAAFSAFMDRFHLAGWRRILVELSCETLTLGIAGGLVALA